jgi:carboxymethylenebutenolidase
MGPNGGGTDSLSGNQIGQKIRDLPPDQIAADLDAVVAYVSKLPASNGKVVVTGYCWGGSQSFAYATHNPNIKAAFVFYGSAPTTGPDGTIDKAALARIKAPVYGFYAGNDARIDATLPATKDAMKELGKKFEPVTYEGAGHGFMRAGEAPEPTDTTAGDYQKQLDAWRFNRSARDEAWARWKKLLAAI